MSRGVDDIDLSALVIDADVFRQNRDTSFSFEVIVVEDQLPRSLVIAEEVSGEEHFVDEGSLTVVDVCDDGYIADVLHSYILLARKGSGLFQTAKLAKNPHPANFFPEKM